MKIKNIQRAFRHGLVWMQLLQRLKKLGLGLEPYYVTQIGDFNQAEPQWGLRFSEYEVGFAGPQDMKEVAGCGEQLSEALLLDRLERGLTCFAIKHRNQIVAYIWCAFDIIDDPVYQTTLNEKEVHLYDLWTRPEFRGNEVAYFMTYQCIMALENEGIETFYTVVDCCNTPSLRFHKKLNMRIVRLGLHVSLANRYSWNYTLRESGQQDRGRAT